MLFRTVLANFRGSGLVLSSALALFAADRAAAEPQVELSSGHVSVSVAPLRQGLRVLCDGVEIIRHSELVVTKPPWAPHYYHGPTPEAVSQGTVKRRGDKQVLRIIHRGQDNSFEGIETLTLHTGGRIDHVFEGRFLREEGEALIQWRIGALNPALFIGRPFVADHRNDVETQDTVPVVARTGELSERWLARDFTSLEIDTRIGPLRIEVKSPQSLIVYDFRKDRWANPEDPYFWFGDLGSRVAAGESIRYHLVYHLPAAGEYRKDRSWHGHAEIESRTDAQIYAQSNPPVIVPRPKQVRFRPQVCDITGWIHGPLSNSEVMIDGSESAKEMLAALRAWVRDQYPGVGRNVVFPEDAKVPRLVAHMTMTRWDRPAEAYELDVAPGGIQIVSADAAGFRHALQTLKQLVTVDADNHLVMRCAEIRDWPSLAFRGVHLFTGGKGPDLHMKLIRNVIGALKMNRLVLQAEYIKWDSQPAIHHPQYGMSKVDVRRILAVCDEVGIEVIPLVMSLGHCQWMFTNDQNLDLAEDPEAKWTYCVTNPRTYEFIFGIYEEALELFEPRWFHIGHDEFTHRGRVPFRPESRKYTPEQLLQMDTLRLRDWLAERGVRTMMWGDMLLGPGEGPDACHAASAEMAAALRKEWPSDIMITDWHYATEPPESFVNLQKFHDAGLSTVAATWYRPRNIVNYAKAALESKSKGLLQTTWAGYSLDPQSFSREIHQYAAYVLAAEAAWNADNPPDADTYPAQARFLDLMGLSPLWPANRPGWVADLQSAYNVPLAAAEPTDWFGMGPAADLSRTPGGDVRLSGVAFRLGQPHDPTAASAIVLRSKLTSARELPTEVEIDIGAPAARLVILHTTNFPCEKGAKVGEYELRYTDGTSAKIDIRYGQNIRAFDDISAAPEAPSLWTGRTTVGEPITLSGLVWDHPHRAKSIESLTMRSANAAGSLMMLGLTGLNNIMPGK